MNTSHRIGIIALVSLVLLTNLPVAACAKQAECNDGCTTHECCAPRAQENGGTMQAVSCAKQVAIPIQVPTLRSETREAPAVIAALADASTPSLDSQRLGDSFTPIPNRASNHLYLRNHILLI
jgi:hypothetical protein